MGQLGDRFRRFLVENRDHLTTAGFYLPEAVGAVINSGRAPVLLNHEGFTVQHRLCEGLDLETADCIGAEIEATGGYHAWEAQTSADPRHWARWSGYLTVPL